MGWSPAVVIVVRHGARLDAADKQWHLTSPTPYDPPLTYSGWNQSKALGARIASILRTRETDDEIPPPHGVDDLGAADRRKRRHKVIIHTSPFLRCVQTSVAISAGLAQNPGHTHLQSSASQSQTNFSHMHSSPRSRPISSSDSPNLAPIPEPVQKVNGNPKHGDNIRKSTVRVDAFLGEWLSPDYFEQITPPPSSIMMIASAKSDLLRREDYSNLTQVRDVITSPQNVGFPGGWGSPRTTPNKEEDDTPLNSLSSLAQALPRRDRTSSLSSMGSNGSRHRGISPNNLTLPIPAEHGIYQPPVPNYAISGSEPIPPGYVAHARDACIDVDYQWDSMREPQSWGNGGEYGEEWSSMHKRFRRGLQRMIDWYEQSDDPGKLMTKTPNTPKSASIHEDSDEDTDLVIILVTHGAGCNALIGALTNQPVLLDVGMASLTMAVHKPNPVITPTSTPGATPKSHSRANSRNLNVFDQYDVKLVANTEHLRTSSVSTPSTSRNPSIAGLQAFRERFSPTGGSEGAGYGVAKPSRSVTASGNFGSMRRAASIASPGSRSYVPSRQSSIGLWSAPPAPEEDATEPEDDMILNFGDENVVESSPIQDWKDEEAKEKDRDEEDEVAPLGLWGSPRPPGVAEKIREIAPKRRWTVNERG